MQYLRHFSSYRGILGRGTSTLPPSLPSPGRGASFHAGPRLNLLQRDRVTMLCPCFTLTAEVNGVICATTDGHGARMRDREHRSGVWRSEPAYASQSACPPHCRLMRAGSREPPCP